MGTEKGEGVLETNGQRESDLKCIIYLYTHGNCDRVACRDFDCDTMDDDEYNEIINTEYDCPLAKDHGFNCDVYETITIEELKEVVLNWMKENGITEADLFPYLIG